MRALVKETMSREQVNRLAKTSKTPARPWTRRAAPTEAERRRSPSADPRLPGLCGAIWPRRAGRLRRRGGPRAGRPPGAIAQPVDDRRDQERADDEGVDQDPRGDGDTDLDQLLQRQQGERGEGAGQDQPGAGDDAAGVKRDAHPLTGAARRRLLPRPGHQEDVVVDAQRDQEEEREQDQVEGDAAAAELGEEEGAEPERGGEGEDDGGDQLERRDQRPQHRGQDQRDHEQDQRHDQPGVAGVGLLDLVVLVGIPASRPRGVIACRRSGSPSPRRPLRPSRGSRRGRRRRPRGRCPRRRHRDRQVHRSAGRWIPAATRWRRRRTTAISGEPSPGGKCPLRTWVPRLESVGGSDPGRSRSSRDG